MRNQARATEISAMQWPAAMTLGERTLAGGVRSSHE
jgi:hypothetical protein